MSLQSCEISRESSHLIHQSVRSGCSVTDTHLVIMDVCQRRFVPVCHHYLHTLKLRWVCTFFSSSQRMFIHHRSWASFSITSNIQNKRPQKNVLTKTIIRFRTLVSSSLGGSVSMRWWLLLWLLLFCQGLLQTHALPGVVLPVQQLLLVDELGALSVNKLLPEVLVLQELQHVQAVRVSAGDGDQRSQPSCLG